MPKKWIIVLIVFLLLAGVASFFLIYQNKLGLFSNLIGSKTNTLETTKVSAIVKDGDYYIVRGRMEEPFKLSEDKTYLHGTFIINGDPNQTPVSVTLSGDLEKNIAVASYGQSFAAVPKVTFKTIDEVKDSVKKSDQVEFRLNSNIKSITGGREPNKHELAIIEKLKDLLTGNWGGLEAPSFAIFSQSIGIIN